MRLTRAGWSLTLGAVVGTTLAWLFGLPELAILSVAALATIVLALVLVRPAGLEIHRSARPARLALGEPCEIRLTSVNRRRRSSPVVTLTDDVGRFGTAQLVLAPLAPGARCVATYSLPTVRRGLHHVGPLTCTVQDPFALAQRTEQLPQVITVIVLPQTWTLTGMPPAPGDEPEHGTHHLTSASTVDEEFAALREYVQGDDIRRIHWPSTARRGTPVVRQFDVPWQRRTTVLVDLRAGAQDAAFERAVSAAASTVRLAARRRELVRLMSTDGTDSEFVPAAEHEDELLDRLAVVGVLAPDRERPEPLLGALSQLSSVNSGRVVTATAGLTASDAAQMGRATRGIGLHVLVCTGRGAAPVTAERTLVVPFDGRVGLDVIWNDVIGAGAPTGSGGVRVTT